MMFEPPEQFNIAAYFLDDRIGEGLAERRALVVDESTGGLEHCHEATYGQVQALANRFGNALTGLGVRQEERVLIALPDGVAFVGAFFGALKIGAVVVMINPALDADQLSHLLGYTRAAAAVVHHTALDAFEAVLAGARSSCRLLVAGEGEHGHPSVDRDVAAADAVLESARTHRDDPAIWLFSGGTTGRPKAVVQTHRSFANTTECYAKRVIGYRASDISLSVPKLFFGYATGSNLLFPFAAGATSILFPDRPTPERLFHLIERYRPTLLINVPTMINRLLAHPGAAERDLSSLRLATSAGEALPVDLHRRWNETFGVELLDGLGTAEMWHIFISNRPGDVRPGTLGRVVPGFEVRVCDPAGQPVADGEAGALWVSGGSRAMGYWQRMDETMNAFRGRWYLSGDLVCRDADGVIIYCGRSDDMIKVAGKWVSPREIEDCLIGHSAVLECAVVGAADSSGLTKPHAFVIAEPGTAEEMLRSYLLERLAGYKMPRTITMVAAMPRTHLGKVDRGALRRLATGPEPIAD